MYSYQISFNGSDYSVIHPEIKLKGAWIENTFIFQEKIDKLRITQYDDNLVYLQLKEWFSDPTKFETRIYVKILKNSVQESLHWFGIKWGEIDWDLTYYEVEPLPYNDYTIKIEPYLDQVEVSPYDDVFIALYNWSAVNDPFLINLGVLEVVQLLETFIKEKIFKITGIAKTDIVSTILFGDNDIEGNSAEYRNGLLVDYITDDYSVFKYACWVSDPRNHKEMKLKDIFEMLRIFQIYPYFDENGKLRFEHIRYFIQKLENNAEYLEFYNYDHNYSYKAVEMPLSETLTFDDLGDMEMNYFDWKTLKLTYSPVRNRPDSLEIAHSFDYYTNADYYYQNRAATKMLVAGFNNLTMDNWANGTMSSFSADRHYLTITAGVATQWCGSANFKSNTLIDVTVYADSITGEFEVMVYDRSDGTLNSDTFIVDTVGETTAQLTIDTPSNDMYIRIVANENGTFEGYIIVKDHIESQYTNPWAVGVVSTDPVMNGDFSKANILNDYWKDYRLALRGTMNGVLTDFVSTIYNKVQKDVNRYWAEVPNPLYGVFNGTYIARIYEWTRVPDTGFIDMTLSYQEDNGVVYLVDDDNNLIKDVNGNIIIV